MKEEGEAAEEEEKEEEIESMSSRIRQLIDEVTKYEGCLKNNRSFVISSEGVIQMT